MKNYLDLIPISAKVHRKQTRMTRLCIVISVFLIAVIFGMADMFCQSQRNQAIQTDGAWHVMFRKLNEEQFTWIQARQEVQTISRYAATNYRLDMGYKIEGVQTVLCGFDESFLELFPGVQLTEGEFPRKPDEALVSESVRDRLQLTVGDTVKVDTPEGSLQFQVSGFLEDTSSMLKSGAFGVFLNTETYLSCFQEATLKEDTVCYVEFVPHSRIQNVYEEICRQLHIPTDQVSENAKLMGLLLQSQDNYILLLYFTALILAALVVCSGMLMILGSLNSNVSQRIEFFGMMRCLGATGKQVRHFVRMEALSWCKVAIPLGLFASMVVIWGLSRMLKIISPTYFGEMPDWGISGPGLLAGCVIGLLTVFLAARTPAKRASKVSPLTAVSGNATVISASKRAANTRLFRVETALGIHHACGSKKTLFLLSASFALSILLYLSFSTGIDFMHHALTPLRPYTPDVSIVSPDNGCTIPDALLAELEENSSVKRVFGRSFAYDLPVRVHNVEKTVQLISYDDYQFGYAKEDLRQGNLEKVQDGMGVLLVAKPEVSAEIGEELELETALGVQSVTVEGILEYAPFDARTGEVTLICSKGLFQKLTGEAGYTILDLQLTETSEHVVEEIRRIAGTEYTFSDQRSSNQEVRAVYYSFALFVYSFLAMIALIAAFNMINSIDMSVYARIRQYGAMRAIGISIRQLKSMVIAETATNLVCGLIAGLVFGIPLHRFLYQRIITERWGDVWSLPLTEFCVIATVLLIAAVIAVAGPMRRIRRMSVVDTIGAQ